MSARLFLKNSLNFPKNQKYAFLNSAIGFSAENPNEYLGSPKGCFCVKTAKSVFEVNITSACPRARYTPPRTYIRPRDRATYVCTYGRYTHVRVRTRAREG